MAVDEGDIVRLKFVPIRAGGRIRLPASWGPAADPPEGTLGG